jgi:hypothetical protein
METGTKTFRIMCWKEERNCAILAPATVSMLKNGNRFYLTKERKKNIYTSINFFANEVIRKIQRSEKALKMNVKRSFSFNHNIKVSEK